MTVDAFITDLIEREGGFVNDPIDRGGPTNRGITARTLGEWRNLGRPATAQEVRDLGEPETREIYEAWYVAPFAAVQDEALRAQLADMAITSGPKAAIETLQRMLGVEADGVLGPLTLAACAAFPPAIVNNLLVAGRMCRAVADIEQHPAQRKFLWGWMRRFASFKS